MKLNKLKKCMQTVTAMTMALLVGMLNVVNVQAAGIEKASVSKPLYGMVNLDDGNLNVRQGATTSSAIIGSLKNYSYIMVVGQEGNFYRVQYDTAGNYGYVSKTYVILASSNYYLVSEVDSGTLNMRDNSTLSSSIRASIPKGTHFAYRETYNEDWFNGVYGNVSGFTSEQYTGIYSI